MSCRVVMIRNDEAQSTEHEVDHSRTYSRDCVPIATGEFGRYREQKCISRKRGTLNAP